MRLLKEIDEKSPAEIGEALHGFAVELFPICEASPKRLTDAGRSGIDSARNV
jgi:hypothetical protein